jgi:methylated-DNA-protein-cysteine methyltransferase related protein
MRAGPGMTVRRATQRGSRRVEERAGKRTGESPGRWERVWAVVRRIPRGRVATYGQVAALAGLGGQARQVGYALHALPGEGLAPWHRVVNARGAISLPPGRGADVTQRLRLEREGVRFDARGRIDLDRFRWRPGTRPAREPGTGPSMGRGAAGFERAAQSLTKRVVPRVVAPEVRSRNSTSKS